MLLTTPGKSISRIISISTVPRVSIRACLQFKYVNAEGRPFRHIAIGYHHTVFRLMPIWEQFFLQLVCGNGMGHR